MLVLDAIAIRHFGPDGHRIGRPLRLPTIPRAIDGPTKILQAIQLDKIVGQSQGKKVSILPTVDGRLGRYFDTGIMVKHMSRIRLKFIGSGTYGDRLPVRSGPIVNFSDVFLFDEA
jgi:hypothetical protein